MKTAQHWVLPKEPESPARARQHLRSVGSSLPRDLLEIALLLTSELVTNAVKYGGEHIVLTVTDEPELFRVEVHDDGPLAPRPGGAVESHAIGGRGLLLVESLAHEWGTENGTRHQPGKGVWFTLRKQA
jgi:anti-sigma regulatory factor (Ser/Thr protein kinase)